MNCFSKIDFFFGGGRVAEYFFTCTLILYDNWVRKVRKIALFKKWIADDNEINFASVKSSNTFSYTYKYMYEQQKTINLHFY